MGDYDNNSNWGKSKAQDRYGIGASATERAFGSPKTTKMPDKGPSDSYKPPSTDDQHQMKQFMKKNGGRA